MGLPDATRQYIGRREAKEAMSLHHLVTLKKEMEGKSKCDKIYNKDVRIMQDFIVFVAAAHKWVTYII